MKTTSAPNTPWRPNRLTPVAAVTAVAALLVASPAPEAGGAPGDPSRQQLASLMQDMELLRTQVGQLKLEVERLSRENVQLRATVKAQATSQAALGQNYVDLARLNRSVAALTQQFKVADAAQRDEIIATVTAQIDALTTKFNRSLKAMAESVNARPSVAAEGTTTFSDDYPKTGVPYVVKSGDTLTSIAQRLGSTVKDIQNANQIARPNRDLRVGQTIFVPQAKP